VSMNKKEQRELENLRRENALLRKEFAGRESSRVFFCAGTGIDGPNFYINELASVYFGGLGVRLLEDGETIYVQGDDTITVYPQSSNVVRIHGRARGKR
jgi:hypothetical protein